MKNLLLTVLHVAVATAKLCGPGGVRAVIAENLLLKQQLIVLRRGSQRAPNLTPSDRLLCGFGSLFLGSGRIRKLAIAMRPSTLLAFHRALVCRKYRRLFSSKRCLKKPGPKGPERGANPGRRRAQVAQSSVRLSTDCVHHLADVRGRHRQERRVPRAVETLSPDSGRNRVLVVVVHRTHQRQPLERGQVCLVSWK
jgi:hypothetical protein